MHLLNAERHPRSTLGLLHALAILADWVWYNQDDKRPTTPTTPLFLIEMRNAFDLSPSSSLKKLPGRTSAACPCNEHQSTPEPNFILESDPCLQDIMLRKGMTLPSRMTLFKFEGQG